MAVYAGAAQLPDAISDDDDLLPVVADLSYNIEILTVEQAVMRLELGGLTMLMFRNFVTVVVDNTLLVRNGYYFQRYLYLCQQKKIR